MFEAEEFDIFVSRQAILGDVCNVCPSLRICAEPLPEEMLPTLHYIENYNPVYYTDSVRCAVSQLYTAFDKMYIASVNFTTLHLYRTASALH